MPRRDYEGSETQSPRPPPDHLYKYRSMEGLGFERIFTHNEVWFASPSGFNDPYDCKVRCILYDQDPSEYARYAEEVMARHQPGMSAEERKQRAKLAAADPHRGEFMSTQLQKDVDGLGIFSVSTTASHPLLWSHYASGHTGLCLKFQREGLFRDETLSESLFPVYYQRAFPLVSEAADRFEQAKTVMLTKSSDWAYELEARYLDWKGGPGYREFRPENLTAVIFGCRMKSDDKEKVRRWIASGESRPRICEATVREAEYALDIRFVD